MSGYTGKPLLLVIATVDERGWPPAIRPAAHRRGIRRITALARRFSRVLDVDEQGGQSGVMAMPVTSQPLGPARNRRVSPVHGFAASIWLLPDARVVALVQRRVDTSVWIHSRPLRRTTVRPGCRTVALDVPRVGSSRRIAAAAKMSQAKRVAAGSPPASRQRMMWPYTLLARGLAASAGALALGTALAVVGQRAVHLSGDAGARRPTRAGPSWWRRRLSAAWRVLTSTSAWSAKPFAGGESTLAVHQRLPTAGAVCGEDAPRATCRRRAGSTGRPASPATAEPTRTCRGTRSARRRPCRPRRGRLRTRLRRRPRA